MENKVLVMNNKLKKYCKSNFIEVDDNWYGNYEGNKIEFRYFVSCVDYLSNNRYIFSICFSVWGNDDFGLNKSYIFEGTYKEYYSYYLTFLAEYNKILNDKIAKNKEYFYNLGYSRL